eukprot:s683_g35.t1
MPFTRLHPSHGLAPVTCHTSCDRCDGASEDDCLSCKARRFLHDRKCLEQCPDGTFGDSDSKACTQCHDSCGSCGELSLTPFVSAPERLQAICSTPKAPAEADCQSCDSQDNFLHNGRCLTACPPQFFADAKRVCVKLAGSVVALKTTGKGGTFFVYSNSTSCVKLVPLDDKEKENPKKVSDEAKMWMISDTGNGETSLRNVRTGMALHMLAKPRSQTKESGCSETLSSCAVARPPTPVLGQDELWTDNEWATSKCEKSAFTVTPAGPSTIGLSIGKRYLRFHKEAVMMSDEVDASEPKLDKSMRFEPVVVLPAVASELRTRGRCKQMITQSLQCSAAAGGQAIDAFADFTEQSPDTSKPPGCYYYQHEISAPKGSGDQYSDLPTKVSRLALNLLSSDTEADYSAFADCSSKMPCLCKKQSSRVNFATGEHASLCKLRAAAVGCDVTLKFHVPASADTERIAPQSARINRSSLTQSRAVLPSRGSARPGPRPNQPPPPSARRSPRNAPAPGQPIRALLHTQSAGGVGASAMQAPSSNGTVPTRLRHWASVSSIPQQEAPASLLQAARSRASLVHQPVPEGLAVAPSAQTAQPHIHVSANALRTLEPMLQDVADFGSEDGSCSICLGAIDVAAGRLGHHGLRRCLRCKRPAFALYAAGPRSPTRTRSEGPDLSCGSAMAAHVQGPAFQTASSPFVGLGVTAAVAAGRTAWGPPLLKFDASGRIAKHSEADIPRSLATWLSGKDVVSAGSILGLVRKKCSQRAVGARPSQGNKQLAYGLICSIFGLGKTTAFKVCIDCDINPYKIVSQLDQCDEEFRLAEEIGNYVLENPLRRMYKANCKALLAIKHRRGVRMQKGLPVHFQRSKTNNRNARKLNPSRF